MTTGRINQVTIVRRGWPSGACNSAVEIQVTGWRPLGTLRHSAFGGKAGCAAAVIRFPPPSSPGQTFRHTRATKDQSAAWAPQEEDSSPCIYHSGVSRARLPPVALRLPRLLEASQPQDPRASGQRFTLQPPTPLPQYVAKPEHPISWRSTPTVISPR
jgi:hypothetical protein